MYSKAFLLLFLLGVVVFITTPSLADHHHDNEPHKPYPGGHKPPEHKPFPEHPGKGKGKEPPHGGKPPHRHLLSDEEVEATRKPPQNPGGGGGHPPQKPHEHEFPEGKPPRKPYHGEKPPEHKPFQPPVQVHPGKGKYQPPHHHQPPHSRRLLGEDLEEDSYKPPRFPGGKPPKGKGEKPPHGHKPPHKPPHGN
ncbi:proline-rich 33 kDa extensin-related protein-like protein [Corchorus capsularis]|uniref:Proline-rich 33 kDa extensin-related protein-like protein n=1 Tax=Corchorus capsularis TaxID=210143 RepID=A0A1R3G9T2_COCAP|nr:proline-rich 33 kDa extensin-related protein-like protein [Corchorus capsularis]